MKTNVLMALAIAVVMSFTLSAQPQRVQPYSGKSPREVTQVRTPENFSLPVNPSSLSEQQRADLQKIRAEQLKERTQTRNLLREKRAKLEVLQTADKPDMNAINRLIDEIAAIQAQEMKAQAASRQKIRSLLTDEQRATFDARGANREDLQTFHRRVRPNDRQDRPGNDRRRRMK
jgi:Spy/CpxP family protein refolding chaperone